MTLGGREAETVFNIVTLLQGKAWDLVEDFTMEQLAASNAFDAVFARLDSGFRYDPLTELPDDFEMFFVKLQRRQGQTLQDYMTEFTKAERRLKISHEVELPEKVKAWWFLRRSGITKEQRQLILTNVGIKGLATDEVMKAMSFILGQDSKTEGHHQRWAKHHKNEAYYYYDDDLEHDYDNDHAGQQMPVFYEAEDEVEAEETWLDDGQDYYYDDDKTESIFDVDEYDEVFSTYQDAKARLNALRTSRGFYPVVVALDLQHQGSCTTTEGSISWSQPQRKEQGQEQEWAERKGTQSQGKSCIGDGQDTMSTLWATWPLGEELPTGS